MRVCIVGGGLAGSLLAWRLADLADGRPGWLIDLVLGDGAPDATAASGGAVRAYEAEPEQRDLAVASLVELLNRPALRAWAEYRPTGTVYLRDGETWPHAQQEQQEIDQRLPGWARLMPAADLADQGFAGLPAGTLAMVEQGAGCIAPDRLRRALLADLAARGRITLRAGPLTDLVPDPDGAITTAVGGRRYDCDLVVLATGACTPALLHRHGLPADGYRTKAIQYVVHAVDGWRPPTFVDTTTGLYGLPTADGGLLLGLPTRAWDVPPIRPPLDAELLAQAARLATARFPGLRLGPAQVRVSAADCYYDPAILALRQVAGFDRRLFTFTGGSGGSAKTSLAASRRAATQLVNLHTTSHLAVSQ